MFNGDNAKDAIGVPDLYSAIQVVEAGLGRKAAENLRLDELLPLYRYDPSQISSIEGVLVATGDIAGLFESGGPVTNPLINGNSTSTIAYNQGDDQDGKLTTVGFTHLTSAIEIDLNNAEINGALSNIEIVGATDQNDILRDIAGSGKTLVGLGGDDTIFAVDNSNVFGDYSPVFLETYGSLLNLTPETAPVGKDAIDLGTAVTATVDAGGEDDIVFVAVTASVAADGATTINIPPGLALDGGAGVDTLVLRITNPLPQAPSYSVSDLPANVKNFEDVQLEYTLEPQPEPNPIPTPNPDPGPPTPYGYAYAVANGLMYHDGNGGYVFVNYEF